MNNESDKRRMFMTKNEIELADRILGYYKAGWQDKHRRGLFDLWENVESYWEGAPRAKDADSPNSNVNFVHPNVEGQVALLMEQSVNLVIEPATPSAQPYADYVKILLEWVKDKNKMRRKIDQHERRREKFGTGIFRVLFDPDAIGNYGLPVIETCNPAYVFPDPAITDIYKIQQGEFIIETLNKPISWARGQFGAKVASQITTGYDPIGNYIFDEDEGGGDSYLHIMAWIRTDGKLRLVQVSGNGILLEDSFRVNGGESFYPSVQFPYFFTPLYVREGTVWAKGDAELLLNLQDLVDELDDQIRINARLSGNPQRLVDVSSNIDVDKWTNESGLIIPTSNIDGAKYLQPPSMPSYPLERRVMALQFERQMVTRFADQMTGNKSATHTTATEAAGLLAQGEVVISHKKALLQETLSEVFEYCLKLMKEYYTNEKMFRLTDGGFVWLKASSLKEVPIMDDVAYNVDQSMRPTGKLGEAEFDIRVKIGGEDEELKKELYRSSMPQVYGYVRKKTAKNS
ncbi:MAG: hypothetical protein LBL34_01025 [Clostridiales bacterium]|jgi:hypothetical protein|nr:hypothetical protein [Clostridiales bacterium]